MQRKRDAERIRALNDRMRSAGFAEVADGARWVLTSGVSAMGAAAVAKAVGRVAAFDAFDEGNDPHGEHDFGALDLSGERLFWKIDYYDRSMTYGSDDPANEAATCRVLTIMLASEY